MSIDSTPPSVHQFIYALRTQLSPEQLWMDPDKSMTLPSAEGVPCKVPGIVYPTNHDQVVKIVELAGQFGVKIYPISKGHNWGYSSSSPTSPSSFIVSLERMKGIRQLDEESGTVLVESGVDQGDLHKYLQTNQSDLITPTTGAGPSGSILGNALERGFGLSPITDHAASILSMKVVLANGKTVTSKLSDLGGHRSDLASSWKVGPYIDGLFSQSNLGIVTEARIRLTHRPAKVRFILIEGHGTSALHELTETLHHLRCHLPLLFGGINISNRNRVLSTFKYTPPDSRWELFAQSLVDRVVGIDPANWTAILALAAPNQAGINWGHNFLKLVVKKKSSLRVRILPTTVILKAFMRWIPTWPFLGKIRRQAEDLLFLQNLYLGTPGTRALELVYPEGHQSLYQDTPELNPAKDGIGVLWYAPIVPSKPEDVTKVAGLIQGVCQRRSYPFHLSFFNFNQLLTEATFPILFNPLEPKEVSAAYQLWDELFETCRKEGYIPYRYGIGQMKHTNSHPTSSDLILRQLKNAIDPNGILSPGRYI